MRRKLINKQPDCRYQCSFNFQWLIVVRKSRIICEAALFHWFLHTYQSTFFSYIWGKKPTYFLKTYILDETKNSTELGKGIVKGSVGRDRIFQKKLFFQLENSRFGTSKLIFSSNFELPGSNLCQNFQIFFLPAIQKVMEYFLPGDKIHFHRFRLN